MAILLHLRGKVQFVLSIKIDNLIEIIDKVVLAKQGGRNSLCQAEYRREREDAPARGGHGKDAAPPDCIFSAPLYPASFVIDCQPRKKTPPDGLHREQ